MAAKRRTHLSVFNIMSTCLLLTIGVLLFLFLFPSKVQAANEGDLTIQFVVGDNGRGAYAVTACDQNATGELVIPSTYKGNPVTIIHHSAFRNCTGLTGITIPKTITTIQDSAFWGCTGLTDITIPSSVTKIGGLTFAKCTNLESITIPDSVTSIGGYIFEDCTNLKSVTLSRSLECIPQNAFNKCSSLKSIIIPEGITEISVSAFMYCTALTDISIPGSVTYIGDSAFSGCSSLIYNIFDNAKYLGNPANPYLFLVESVSKDITQCQIHPNTKFIGFRAFVDHPNLTAITIPDSVISIGGAAFTNCPNMTDFTIGKGLQSFDTPIFYACAKLKGVWVAEDNPYYASDSFGVLFNKDKTTLLHAPDTLSGSYTVPDSVTTIGYAAFCGCDNLTQVTIGKNVESISSRAFGSCPRLTAISIAEENPNFKVDSIGALFFADGSILLHVPNSVGSSYTVPNGVTTIANYAFFSCLDLESIIIPTTMAGLGDFPYTYCAKLKTIYYGGTQNEWKKILPHYAAGPSWDHIEVVFQFTGTTVPTPPPTTTPTDAPNIAPTNTEPATDPQHTRILIPVLIGMVAAAAIGAAVFVIFKKKRA